MKTTTVQPASDLAGKYLSLSLDREAYALPVGCVREIIRFQAITPVPQSPAHIKGVINLRGRVVPVVDLRTQFGLPAEITARTCIVVVHPVATRCANALGLIVDNVDEVLTVSAADIEPIPEFGLAVDTRYLRGLAKSREGVRILLEIEQILAPG